MILCDKKPESCDGCTHAESKWSSHFRKGLCCHLTGLEINDNAYKYCPLTEITDSILRMYLQLGDSNKENNDEKN